MNIIEAYIKFNKKLVIFISGLSGCGKTIIAKKISDRFNLRLIKQFNYYKKDYNETITLSDDNKYVNWSNDNAIDWDKLNDDINKYKNEGIIVTGFALTDDKIIEKPDYHIHVKISKGNCIERRKDFIKHKHQDNELINKSINMLEMNKLIYPYYLETRNRSKINKFLNANEQSDNDMFENADNVLLEYINNNVYKLHKIWNTKGQSIDSSDDQVLGNKISKELNKDSEENLDKKLLKKVNEDSEKEHNKYVSKQLVKPEDNELDEKINNMIDEDKTNDGQIAFLEYK